MSTTTHHPQKIALLAGVAALALIFGTHMSHFAAGDLVGSGKAFAQSESGHGGGGQGRGQGGPGYQGGRAGSSATGGGAAGQGQGGPGEDSDAKGPQYKGGQGTGSQGGKPVWAQEGIPEVELGRLSVVRSPDRVIDKALAEALANFDPAKSAALYSMTAAQFAAYVQANFDTVVRIDSPLENLGLLKDVLANRTTQLPQVTNDVFDLAGIFLGSAADKTIPITKDTVIAVTKILGVEIVHDVNVTAVAEKAEIVRQAIATAHG